MSFRNFPQIKIVFKGLSVNAYVFQTFKSTLQKFASLEHKKALHICFDSTSSTECSKERPNIIIVYNKKNK